MGNWAYSAIFARLLVEFIRNIEDVCTADMVIAVPISRQRLNERGFDQTELILDCMKKELPLNYKSGVLERKVHTKHQSRLAGYERFSNISNAFAVRSDVRGKKIVVFDDVYTTGYTMEACAKTLIEGGAREVIALTLAKVPELYDDTGARYIL